MYVESTIYKTEKLNNKDKKFGAAKQYYQAFVIDSYGKKQWALFTEHELEQAINRGSKNPEDKGVSVLDKPKWYQFWK